MASGRFPQPKTMSEEIKRAGPPQAVQKLRENFYLVQIPLSDVPSADWKRLFYDTQQAPPAEFPPRAIEMSSHLLRFRTEPTQVEEKTGWIDRWITRANQKEAAMGGRLEEERRRRREESQREQVELAELNQRWEKL
jgi:hypothetical protein